MLSIADGITQASQHLSKTVLDLLKPEPGPYALFAHLAQLHKRLKQIKIITERLYDGRYQLLKSSIVQDIYRPRNWPPGVPYPHEYNEIGREHSLLDENLDSLRL